MYLLCIMGNPVSQSLSPQIHAKFADEFNLSLSYERIEVPLNEFKHAVEKFKQRGGVGMNITTPFKVEAFHLANQLTDRAKIAGAVNTFVFKKNGEILGDNTDGVGLLTDIQKNLRYSISGKRILLLGAGGAIRGILWPLLNESPEKVIIANRTIEKARTLAQEFKKIGNISSCGLDEIAGEFDLVIDGTSFSNEFLSLPKTITLSAESLFYDLKYQSPSAFLNWAKRSGAKHAVSGMGMLIEQAAESFYLWTNRRPNPQALSLGMFFAERHTLSCQHAFSWHLGSILDAS